MCKIILVGKAEGLGQFGGISHSWEINIAVNLKKKV
jgi:hypothetical protein